MNNLKSKFAIYSLFAISLLFSAFTVRAQVVDTPEGKVEFIGLDKWSIEKIKAIMAEKAPGEPLGQCAAVLVQIGFPTASSSDVGKINGKDYTVVTLVEPEKANLLKKKPEFSDSLPDVENWRKGIDILTKNNRTFQRGVIYYPLFLKGETAKVDELLTKVPQSAEGIKSFFQFLKTKNTVSDQEHAIWTLYNDGNRHNRMIAAAILANFADSDLTWWTLLDAHRDPIDSVAGTSSQVLTALSTHTPRKVNWMPAIHSIRYLIRGTNVFLFRQVLRVLTNTNINPVMAKSLLKDENHLLLAHLTAQYKDDAEVARNFLKQLSGKDYGYEIDKWRQWIKEI